MKGVKKVSNNVMFGDELADWSVFFPRKVYDKLLFIARECDPNEVQFLGEVKLDAEASRFVIKQVHLLDQKVSFGSASFDMASVAAFLSSHKNPEALKCWIHSHVSMGTFWSSIDTDTIAKLARSTGWLVSVVMCVDGSMKARMDVDLSYLSSLGSDLQKSCGLPSIFFPARVTFDPFNVVVADSLTAKEKERYRKEISEKVKEEVTRPYYGRQSFLPGTTIHTISVPNDSPSRLGGCLECGHLLIDKGKFFCGESFPGRTLSRLWTKCGRFIPAKTAKRPADCVYFSVAEDLNGNEIARCSLQGGVIEASCPCSEFKRQDEENDVEELEDSETCVCLRCKHLVIDDGEFACSESFPARNLSLLRRSCKLFVPTTESSRCPDCQYFKVVTMESGAEKAFCSYCNEEILAGPEACPDFVPADEDICANCRFYLGESSQCLKGVRKPKGVCPLFVPND